MKLGNFPAWLTSGLLLLSCSSIGSGGGGTGGPPTGGLTGSAGNRSTGTIGIGAGSGGSAGVDCANGPDRQGCACPVANQQRSCQMGTCSGTQTCIASGSNEFLTMTWGPCTGPVPPGGCGPSTGAGGAGTGDGTGGSRTGDGSGGSRTGDGVGGRAGGSTGDGMPRLCTDKTINNEPEILVAYSPLNGRTVSVNGQIRVWVNDEGAPFISPNEQLDPATGAVTVPGDHTARAPDGYLWEPALYIAPATAENGGTPHFPQMIKGWYNYPGRGKNAGFPGAPIEPVPGNPPLSEMYTSEDIWDVSALGLSPGTYILEFVVWDGDEDRAVGCITVVVVP